MTWAGSNPGVKSQKLTLDLKKDEPAMFDELTKSSQKMVEEFKKDYPKESTLQLGMGRNVEYQALISLMDGVRFSMGDLVLISYNEADVQNKLLKDR